MDSIPPLILNRPRPDETYNIIKFKKYIYIL